ncbi:uncharacterized protein DEA37_0011107 [Paragonimus westermani]|uniref:Reverse transcriptase RNase H-like domain-containing protein n=1 Tax=Paragonimus westermani TaxID=34504 RepID=A0A5J4NT91_9TREM|nr:uncharacterized protein DEA37_0011107 [Paragonimus westermani]
MSSKDDLSTPYVKSTVAQPTVTEDRGEFRPSHRQPHVFHSDDNVESLEFAVTIYLAGVPLNIDSKATTSFEIEVLNPLRHFRPYMLDKPFKIRADHQSLQWLRNFGDPEVKSHASKNDYKIMISFTSTNVGHDMEMLTPCRVTVPSKVNTTLLYDDDTLWAEGQLDDSYIANIYKRQADGSSKPSAIAMRQKSSDERASWSH